MQNERPRIEEIIKELQNALNFEENRRDFLRKFSSTDIDLGTQNFDDDNCVIRGAFGKAYNGKVQYHNELKDIVAMRLYRCDQEDDFFHKMEKADFLTDHEILMAHKHENIINLVGYCREGNEKIIIYELAFVGTLEMHLSNGALGWVERLCIDVAIALEFLHGSVQVIHRDIKSASILLNIDWRAQISDFGLYLAAPLNKKIENYDINNVFSTPGYCDPSYWETGFLTKESDIYSLGVVLFEVLYGRSTLENNNNEGQFLDDSVKKYFEEKRHNEIVFEDIEQQIVPHSLTMFQMIANQCLHHRRHKQPKEDEVVVQLKNLLKFQMEHSSAVNEGLKGVQDAMEIKLGYLPKTSEVFETTHLKRGLASWETLECQQKLKAQLEAKQAPTVELEQRIVAKRARTAKLVEMIVAKRARTAELLDSKEAKWARTIDLEERMEAEQAQNIELEVRIMAERARNAELEETIVVERARIAELEERIENLEAQETERESKV